MCAPLNPNPEVQKICRHHISIVPLVGNGEGNLVFARCIPPPHCHYIITLLKGFTQEAKVLLGSAQRERVN